MQICRADGTDTTKTASALGAKSATPLRFVHCHSTGDWFVKFAALVHTKRVLMKPKVEVAFKIIALYNKDYNKDFYVRKSEF